MNKTIKRVGIILILFIAIQLVIQVLCMVAGLFPVILNTLKHEPDKVAEVFQNNATSEQLALPLCVSTILSGVLTVFILWKCKYVTFDFRKSWTSVPLRILLVCVPLTLCAMFFLNVLTEIFPLPDNHLESFLAMSKTGVWGFLAIAVCAPVCEEFTFRGAIEGTLLKTTSPWIAILTSSLIFGIIHMNPVQIPFAFVLGTLLGWLYYKTQSLVPGILAHFINNTIGFVTLSMTDDPNQTTEGLLGKPLTISLMILSIILFTILLFILNKLIGKTTNNDCAINKTI